MGILRFMLLGIFLASPLAHAVELRKLSIEWYKYPYFTSFAELPDEKVREELAVKFNVDLGANFSLYARVDSFSTDAQFRWVSLAMDLGWKPWPSLELFAERHKSQHCLDCTQPYGRHFPVADGVGAEWTIYASPASPR